MSLKVAVLTQHGEWSASTRSRALQHVDRLASRLGTVDVFPADDRPERRPGVLGRARYFSDHGMRYAARYRDLARLVTRYDALFVQRGLYALGPGSIVRAIERFDGQVVYDLDDALYAETPAAQGKGPLARWIYGPQQSLRMLERADEVVVSTEALASALPLPKQSVTVLPTVPDVPSYAQAEDGGTPGLIGWAGTNGGLRYLDPLAEVFSRLRADGTGYLRVVSSARWAGPSEFRTWRLEDETRMFASFAVGIMPLPDTDYAQAKAGFKLLQYMAAGVPVVASPVGVNRHLVEQSGAGFLAESPSEWEQALRTLLADPDHRAEMGRSGRAFVEQFANPEQQAATLADLLRRGTRGVRGMTSPRAPGQSLGSIHPVEPVPADPSLASRHPLPMEEPIDQLDRPASLSRSHQRAGQEELL